MPVKGPEKQFNANREGKNSKRMSILVIFAQVTSEKKMVLIDQIAYFRPHRVQTGAGKSKSFIHWKSSQVHFLLPIGPPRSGKISC